MAAKVRRNDTVEITTGKDRGKRGEVRRVLPKEQRLVVSGANIVKRHRRQRSATEASAIVELEAPLHVSNVRVVCPACTQAVRVGFRILEDGRKIRYCKRCNESVD
ncbi:MAG: 50S ribosomal protein L24 [Dehalococcoidia bacterium]|nr:50S ribosomal protein L24 [Dehalococcoidia bacterium]